MWINVRQRPPDEHGASAVSGTVAGLMDDLSLLPVFLTSLGLGLLIGIERQRHPDTPAGMRTFALTSVTGTACGLLTDRMGGAWLLPVVILALALALLAADRHRVGEAGAAPRPPDVTTTVALLLCTLYGAMIWEGYVPLTVALALVTTALLYFKTELHDASEHLSRQDMISILQFGAISFVVLPILPDQGYGPYGVLNPHDIWLMVVLVAGVGLAGYATLRLAGPRKTPLLLGLLGGLISSTATTLVFARRARTEPGSLGVSQMVILTANLVLLLRISLMAALVAPGVALRLIPMLMLALLAGLGPLLRLWRHARTDTAAEGLGIGNPLELPTALGFGLVYGGALVVTAWLHEQAGHWGVYAAAPVLGLTDMDAISLSTLQMFQLGQLGAHEVCVTLALAIGANLLFKAAIARAFGGPALGRTVSLGFLAVLAALVAGVVLLA
ncbi:MAG TPA: MgtC/SapB family protein [Solimonas sp.]|nr:MgtC/SapB family protein [Solimonas sp.]